MSRELPGYRENLQDILEFFDGKRMLSIKDVMRYTGIGDYHTIHRRFVFIDHYISAPSLARAMCHDPG